MDGAKNIRPVEIFDNAFRKRHQSEAISDDCDKQVIP